MADNDRKNTVETTGHVWDDDLREYNNPLPSWWTYAFYITIVFAVVYWLIYPSWPLATGFLTGVSKIEYVNTGGENESWHWNTRAKLLREMQDAAAEQKTYYDRIAAMSYEAVAKDPELFSFVQSAGKALISDNCAASQQSGGGGKIGLFPNLTDDDWMYGGSHDAIYTTIAHGRQGYMPGFAEALSAAQVDALSSYVLSLSGEPADAALAAQGKTLFHSRAAACYYCHGDNAKGRLDIGSANLTDKIWVWADVPGSEDPAAKLAAVRGVIQHGLDRGVMPAWEGRLKPEQMRVLTLYVHDALGGGQ